MIGFLTKCKVADNSGAYTVRCIKVLNTRHRTAKIGDVLVVVVKTINTKKDKIKRGTMKLALVIRTRKWFKRDVGVNLRFMENTVILINKKKAPLSKRFKGPMFYEICHKYRFIGSLAKDVI
jgi:large subunit ribosomal protein L14